MDSTNGIQKFHTEPTPRVGGLPILIGLFVAWFFASRDISRMLGLMLIAGLPAFCFGLAEDITKRVGVRERLLATIASGAIACYLNDGGLNRLDVWGIDALMRYWPISLAFTAFAVGGVANSINIIDGFNGLAGGAILISLCALGLVASSTGDRELAELCFIVGGVVIGFLCVNFPLGKIFLGDGGAYLMGFLLAWSAVLLLVRNPGVSVWSPLLACGFPVIEVAYSIWRRRRHKMDPGSPDRLHLHSLVKVRLVLPTFKHLRPVYRNALVSPMMWAYAMIPATLGVVVYANTPLLIVSFILSIGLYHAIYSKLERRRSVRKDPSHDGLPAIHFVSMREIREIPRKTKELARPQDADLSPSDAANAPVFLKDTLKK